ncbi:MAG: glycosyltransferase family 2 protein [Candidatus Omnitrophica bacterium]|nr:glycosyltransferase family 2 protein [Candidatus Omnitrophota bacterium]MDD5310544.1 glycosyltransferase family 2 protein [Candidatus Omnitrophota bacterium]MDD5546030.1 glycosyltransferase family 2 protein [Candidatus Omnitrophota bacterium]
MNKNPGKISVIIPVYNEEKALKGVLSEITASKGEVDIDEVIVVDDASTDNSGLIAGDSGARVIRHKKNLGYGASLKTGIRNARNEVLVFLDGDGQHNPGDIKKMVEKLNEGNDMVIGERMNARELAESRSLGKFVLKWVTNFIADTEIKDVNCGFRVTRKSVIEKYLGLLSDQFSFSVTSTIVFIKSGLSIEFCRIMARKRQGVSHVKQFRDGSRIIVLILRLIALFDPIRIFFSIGIFLFTIGAGYGAYKFVTVKQGLSIGALIIVISGILSVLLGIICDQIASLRLEKYK